MHVTLPVSAGLLHNMELFIKHRNLLKFLKSTKVEIKGACCTESPSAEVMPSIYKQET